MSRVFSSSLGWHGHCALLIIQCYPAWALGSGCLTGHIRVKAKQADSVAAAEFVHSIFFFKIHVGLQLHWNSLQHNKEMLINLKGATFKII